MRLDRLHSSPSLEKERGYKDGFDAGSSEKGHNDPVRTNFDLSTPYGLGFKEGYMKGFREHPSNDDMYWDVR